MRCQTRRAAALGLEALDFVGADLAKAGLRFCSATEGLPAQGREAVRKILLFAFGTTFLTVNLFTAERQTLNASPAPT
jgi:hypothetical protein